MKDITIDYARPRPILKSYKEYCEWYGKCYDFSMFPDETILRLLHEDRPMHYPCIPLITDSYGGIFYLSVEFIQSCIK